MAKHFASAQSPVRKRREPVKTNHFTDFKTNNTWSTTWMTPLRASWSQARMWESPAVRLPSRWRCIEIQLPSIVRRRLLVNQSPRNPEQHMCSEMKTLFNWRRKDLYNWTRYQVECVVSKQQQLCEHLWWFRKVPLRAFGRKRHREEPKQCKCPQHWESRWV